MFTVQGGLFSGTPDAPVTVVSTETQSIIVFNYKKNILASFFSFPYHIENTF